MELTQFEAEAADLWREIPPVFRAGVEALVVEPRRVSHPEIPGVYTLGECITDHWPSAYSEQGGDVRSRVVLYHGSFREVAGMDPAFDWRWEIWETLLHELLHHREFAASEAGLEDYDWAVDQNFKRHADRDFDPTFYRAVPSDAEGVVRLESEIFVESVVRPDDRDAGFGWRDRSYTIRVPPSGDMLYVNPRNLAEGRLWVVVRREAPWWRRLLGAGWSPEGVEHLRRRALPVPAG